MADNTGKQNQRRLETLFSRLVEQKPKEDNNNDPALLLDEFVVNISEDIKETDYKKHYEKLNKIYANDFRHSYSRVTEKLISLDTDKTKLIAKFDIILQNIISIKGYIDEKLKELEENNEEKNQIRNILKRFNKLEDHINLEHKRFVYISNEYGKEINEIKDKAEKLETNLKNKAEKLENDIEQSKKDLENSKINYVTILGIFSAIIISFTSGIGFSNQILNNVGKVDFSILLMIVSIIAIFIGNIIFALFWFILHLNNKVGSFSIKEPLKEPFWKFTFSLNAIFIVIFLISICLYNSNKKITNDKILENNQTIVIDLNNTKTK